MKEKNNGWNIGALGFLLGIIVFIAGNLLSAIYSVNLIEAAIICVVIILICIVCWIATSVLIYMYLKTEETELEKIVNKNKAYYKCDKRNSLCCYKQAFEVATIEIDVDKEAIKNERIILEKEMTEIEGDTAKWKNIWIFSETLETEILNGHAEVVLAKNCALGIKYSIFYLESLNNINELNARKQIILDSLYSTAKKNLSFQAIKTDNKYVGRNTLPLVCGVILFSQGQKDINDGTIWFQEGYLSMRKDSEHKPIYYKMTSCMLGAYSKAFKQIVKNNSDKENDIL